MSSQYAEINNNVSTNNIIHHFQIMSTINFIIINLMLTVYVNHTIYAIDFLCKPHFIVILALHFLKIVVYLFYNIFNS